MNRDAILATIIGLALGLTITVVVVLGPNLLSHLPKINLSLNNLTNIKPSQPNSSPGPTGIPKEPTFSVTSPLPDAIVNSANLLVSGSALPGSTVLVSGSIDDDILIVGSEAKFAGKITLSEGKNEVAVTQYINGKPTVAKVYVYYTQENL